MPPKCYELQNLRDGKLETFAHGDTIGTGLGLVFAPVTTQKVRLQITNAPGDRRFRNARSLEKTDLSSGGAML